MNEYPSWYDEDKMKDGILIIGIYFRSIKDNHQYDVKRFLSETLIKYLRKCCPEVKVEPIEYALTRYVSPVKRKGRAGKAKGGEYKYMIENATPKFYEKLFEKLEEKKKKGEPEWFGDYYVLIAEVMRIYHADPPSSSASPEGHGTPIGSADGSGRGGALSGGNVFVLRKPWGWDARTRVPTVGPLARELSRKQTLCDKRLFNQKIPARNREDIRDAACGRSGDGPEENRGERDSLSSSCLAGAALKSELHQVAHKSSGADTEVLQKRHSEPDAVESETRGAQPCAVAERGRCGEAKSGRRSAWTTVRDTHPSRAGPATQKGRNVPAECSGYKLGRATSECAGQGQRRRQTRRSTVSPVHGGDPEEISGLERGTDKQSRETRRACEGSRCFTDLAPSGHGRGQGTLHNDGQSHVEDLQTCRSEMLIPRFAPYWCSSLLLALWLGSGRSAASTSPRKAGNNNSVSRAEIRDSSKSHVDQDGAEESPQLPRPTGEKSTGEKSVRKRAPVNIMVGALGFEPRSAGHSSGQRSSYSSFFS